MKVLFLGTGTSVGVPMIACRCRVCLSGDPRNKRHRTSVLLRQGDAAVLIDSGPEFRVQALRFGIDRLDAVLYTHAHADHVMGFDDLRAFNMVYGRPVPVYGTPETLAELRRMFSYAFRPVQGGSSRPEVELHEIRGPFSAAGVDFTPVPVWHGDMPVTGFRTGGLAYVTDVSRIPPESMALLQGLEVLILGALRHRPHPTHMTIAEALAVVERLRPRRAYFTHISHEIDHDEVDRQLPPHVRLAYDGLEIEV